jgi:acyl-CoA synthetase (AMP-forming)/AMP-acid ligase II
VDYVLLDEDGTPCEEGELCVTGPQLMLGYHGDHERTEAAFVDDPRLPFAPRLLYRTGDIGYEDGGLMYLKGRIDGLVKIRGYRIHPDEVSKAIDTIEGVDVSAVVPFGSQSEAALAAFVRLHKGAALSDVQIIERLRETLPAYMIPSRLMFVDEFPLNQSGKIDKKALAGRL